MQPGPASLLQLGQYSTNAAVADMLGDEKMFPDVTLATGQSGVQNSQSMRSCVLVYNTSGVVLPAGAPLKFVTGYHRKRVQLATAGAAIHCYAPPFVAGSTSGSIPNNSYFYAVVEGPTQALSDGSVITSGSKLTVGDTTGRVGVSGIDVDSSAVGASAAVTNTVVATTFDKTSTIQAASLQAGDVIRVRAQVIATSTNSTDTLQLNLLAGATVIGATAAVDVANNDIGTFIADIVIRTNGASGTLVASGEQSLGTPGTVTAKPFNKGSTAVDTTAAIVIGVQATWSVASASNSCRLDILDVMVISAGSGVYPAGTALEADAGGSDALVDIYANCHQNW